MPALIAGLVFLPVDRASAQTYFSHGNLAVVQMGTVSQPASTDGEPVSIVQFTTSGTQVSTVTLPSTGPNAFILDNSATEGFMSLSANNQFLVLGGYNTNLQTSSLVGFTSTNVSRAVATIDGYGNYALPITNANIYSTFNIRGAAEDSMGNFFVSGSGGTGATIANGELGIIYLGNPPLETNVTVTETGTGNERCLNIYNNTLYLSTGAGTGTFGRGIYVVSNSLSGGIPTNAGSLLNNSNIMQTGSASGPYDFVINAASTIAYVAEDNLGGIIKFTSTGPGGLWVSNYTIPASTTGAPTGTNAEGVTADFTQNPPVIYATTGESTTNRLISIVDTGASATATLIATAPSGTIYRGVRFVPSVTPQPTMLLPFYEPFPSVLVSTHYTNQTLVLGYANDEELGQSITEANGASSSSTLWTIGNSISSSCSRILTTNGASGLTYPGLTNVDAVYQTGLLSLYIFDTSSTKSRAVTLNVPPSSSNAPLSLYASVLLNIQTNQFNSTNGPVPIFGLTTNTTTNTSINQAGADIYLNNSFQLQVGKATNAPETNTSAALVPGNSYLLVLRYQYNPGSNDEVDLWVDPTALGSSVVVPPPTISTTNNGNLSSNFFGAVAVFEVPNPPLVFLDEIRVATNWGGVTPTNPPPGNIYAVARGGPAGFTLGLSGSDVHVTYFLYTNGISTGQSVVGTGSAVTFGPQTATAFYTILGSNTVTSNVGWMSGRASLPPGTPTVTWTTPAPITNGTALSSNQLDATSNVPGTFAYTPSIGTLLNAGTNTLSVLFTPTDNADYQSVTATVNLLVLPAGFGTAQTFATLYQEDWGAAYAAGGGIAATNFAQVGWNEINIAYTGMYAAPAGSIDVGTGITLSNRAMYLSMDGANPGAGMAYTSDASGSGTSGDSSFADINPTNSPAGLLLSVETQAGTSGTLLTNYFAIQVAGSWYVSATPNTNNNTQGGLSPAWSLNTLLYTNNSSATNWNNLTVVPGASVTIGHTPAAPLTGLITGVGLVVTQDGTLSGTTGYAFNYLNLLIGGAIPVTPYQENWGAAYTASGGAAATNLAQVGWNEINFAYSGMYAAPAGSIDVGTGITLSNRAMYLAMDGANSGAGMAYTTDASGSGTSGDSSFADINPTNYPAGMTLNVETQAASSETLLTNYFAIQVAGSWYISATPNTNNNQQGGTAWSLNSLLYTNNSAATNWNTLTVVPGTSVTVGGTPSAPLSGLITGVGLVVIQNGSLSGTIGYAFDYLNLFINAVTNLIPTIAWINPASILYGTSLSSGQLNATANVPGTFAYFPPIGTVLSAGTNTLSVILTPTATGNYPTTNNVNLVVSPASLTVTSANASRGYGQTNPVFTGTITGLTNGDNITATYSCSATTSSPGATYAIVPSLVDPNNRQTNYAVNLVNGTLTVTSSNEVVTWAAPASILYGTPLTSNQLDATANLPGTFAYSPTNGTLLNTGINTLSVLFTPTDITDYPTVNTTVNLLVLPATPMVTWPQPAAITYGTSLSSTQLNATANVPGAFVYNPANGAVLNAGANTLHVIFTPTDTGHYTSATNLVSLTVLPAPLTVTAASATRAFGQTNPAFTGTVTGVTNGDIITATYNCSATTSSPATTYAIIPSLVDPNNRQTNYAISLVNGTLSVTNVNEVVTWAALAAIAYGTPLTTNQLDANANIAGSFAYNPPGGTVLNTGTNMLAVIFTPADSTDYSSATNQVNLVVTNALLTVTAASVTRPFAQTNPVFVGTISGLQNGDNITASYSCSATTVSAFGIYPIVPALVDPNHRQTNYTVNLVNGILTVTNVISAVTWATPAAILYGTPLASNQLNATANVPGAFAYNPTNGVVLNTGSYAVSVIFIPTDNVDYTSVTDVVNLVVSPGSLNVMAVNATREYGQTNPAFTGTITGLTNGDNITANYSCSATPTSPLGPYNIVPSLLDPNHRGTNYTVNPVNGTLTVIQAAPVIIWTNPAPFTYGTPLSSTQLNASSNVPGSFAYNPPNVAVLYTGTNALSVIFTPTDTVHYSSATNWVSLVVLPAPLIVTAGIASRTYGQTNPVFTGTITGLTNGDNITAAYSCNATTNSLPGTYSIVPGLLDPNNLQSNYTVSLVRGNLTVNPPAAVFAFSSASYSVHESNSQVFLTVENSAGLAGYLSYQTVDGSAHSGNGLSGAGDYVSSSGNLPFASGQSSLSFSIQIINNFINGSNLQFQVLLLNPTVGSLGTPMTATVTIMRDDLDASTNALLAQVLPANRPTMNGQLTVWLPPATAGGGWRFPWEFAWRNSGGTASNLVAGDYPVQFRNVPGYLAIPLTNDPLITNGETTVVTNEYYPTPLLSSGALGSLTVNITPANLSVIAGWQFFGETTWRASGSTAANLLPDTYLVTFEPVSGYATPTSLAVLVSNGMNVTVSGNYTNSSANTTAADLPELLSTGKIQNYTNGPYGFSGQLQTDVGFGSGAAVTANVVLTAAHMVFNDNTLSYVSNAWWSFQEQAGVFQPEPQAARGWYVLSGYAAQRTNDLTVRGFQPDQSSSQSEDLDVAALYFLTYSARTGFGGYISSDAVPNPYLTGSTQKTLVGYPVDGSMFGQVLSPGAMYATQLDDQAFYQTNDQVYAASWLFSYPGNSGGPLCVQYANNNLYYPAAVYLGTLFHNGVPYASVVRAIDSNVVNLITLTSGLGDLGTNNSGGGVITIIPSLAVSQSNPGYLILQLGPAAAVQAGAAWKLTNQPDSYYSTANPSLQEVTSTNTLVLQFKPVSGWSLPTNQTVVIMPGQITTNTAFYTQINASANFSSASQSGTQLQMVFSAGAGQHYALDRSTNLSTWTPLITNAVPVGGTLKFSDTPGTNNSTSVFYRARLVP